MSRVVHAALAVARHLHARDIARGIKLVDRVVGKHHSLLLFARRLPETEAVSIRLYDIIYRITEDIEKALKGMLKPEYTEKHVGKAQVLAVFPISKVGKIAGCRVVEGELRRNGKIRLTRGNDMVFEG